MTRVNSEFEKFDAAIGTILKADPAKVKAEMGAAIEASKAERKARGERKRGRKPGTEISIPASSAALLESLQLLACRSELSRFRQSYVIDRILGRSREQALSKLPPEHFRSRLTDLADLVETELVQLGVL
jgi:hypothetical protein